MATQAEPALEPEHFRWKLFLMVVVIMGSITAAAIVLALIAHPRRGSVHAPPPQPISLLNSPGPRPPNACERSLSN